MQATPTPPPATAEPPATNTITNPPPIESENRSVSYRFTVPGTGTVKTSIKVIDADGEREIQAPLDVVAGIVLQNDSVAVRGIATFILFVDGVEVERQQR